MATTHRNTMTAAERFFWTHAGTSYDPQTETRAQGRRRGAEALASAEAWATEQGMAFAWDWDECGESLEDMNHATASNPEGWCEPECGRAHEVLAVIARFRDRSVAGALGGVIDPDANYRRVIEAELAAEARHEAMAALMEGI